MRNGFGLKLLHKFFNLPFLQLQRETLLKQLDTNEEETRLTTQELDLFQEGDDADYNKFLDNLVNKRRAIADSVSASALTPNITSSLSTHQISPSNSSASLNLDVKRSSSMPGPIGPIGGGTPIPVKNLDFKFQPKKETPVVKSGEITVLPQTSKTPHSSSNTQSLPKVEVTKTDDSNHADLERRDSTQKPQSFMSKIFGKKDEEGERQNANINTNDTITSVEDFVPDDGMLDRSFLDDNSQATPQKVQQEQADTER